MAGLWFIDRNDHGASVTAYQLAKEIERAGYGTQNNSRLAAGLARDRRVARSGRAGFRLRVEARRSLGERFQDLAGHSTVEPTSSVLPDDLFAGTRGYIEKVVFQINGSFDVGLFDCCAVMCRRLLETLIIEVYESKGWAEELRGPDGRFQMLAGLLAHLEQERRFHCGRNTLDGLRAFKKLGDQSAHDRRFNARANDITRVRDGIRVTAEDLLHLAGLAG